MCNINLVYCRKGNDHRVHELMNIMSLESWGQNSDGEGYIAIREDGSVTMNKSRDKIMYHDDASCIVSHQRWATHGTKDADNAHPYETENYILMHNGILSGECPDKTKSDSWHFAQELQNTPMSFKKAFHKVAKNWSGSASMVIYDKRNRKLFYTKNSTASFHILIGEDWIIGSTIKCNVEYAKTFLNMKEEILVPNNDMFIDVLKGFAFASKHCGIATYKWVAPKSYATACTTYTDKDWELNDGVWRKKIKESEDKDIVPSNRVYQDLYSY